MLQRAKLEQMQKRLDFLRRLSSSLAPQPAENMSESSTGSAGGAPQQVITQGRALLQEELTRLTSDVLVQEARHGFDDGCINKHVLRLREVQLRQLKAAVKSSESADDPVFPPAVLYNMLSAEEAFAFDCMLLAEKDPRKTVPRLVQRMEALLATLDKQELPAPVDVAALFSDIERQFDKMLDRAAADAGKPGGVRWRQAAVAALEQEIKECWRLVFERLEERKSGVQAEEGAARRAMEEAASAALQTLLKDLKAQLDHLKSLAPPEQTGSAQVPAATVNPPLVTAVAAGNVAPAPELSVAQSLELQETQGRQQVLSQEFAARPLLRDSVPVARHDPYDVEIPGRWVRAENLTT